MERLGSSDGPRPAAEQASLDAVLDFVLRPMPDTDAVDLRLGLARESGAQIALRAYPRPGSAFAERTAARKPYSLQSAPQASAAPAPVALVAVGEDPAFVELLVAVLEAQGRAGVAGAAQTAQRLRPLLARLSGALVGTVRPAGAELTADLALPLRAGVAPGARAGRSRQARGTSRSCPRFCSSSIAWVLCARRARTSSSAPRSGAA